MDQTDDSIVEYTRPRNVSGTCRSSCEKFSTDVTATADRERPMKNSAAAKLRIWLKMI